jgi:signal transduction histidine kinase
MLEGHDAAWIDPGARRQAFYTNLPHGDYRFRVIAANASGEWNLAGAAVSFTIPPTFIQSSWFIVVCVAITLFVSWGAYRLRVAQVSHHIRTRLEERMGGRTRIARELHDTLLQTFQGVVFHFQAATNMLPGRPDDAKRKFESALDQAARALTEGRDAVQAMRESVVASDDLTEALSALATHLFDDVPESQGATVRVNVEGRPRSLRPVVRDDVYRIASEAMRNAARHARAGSLQVDLHYDRQRLRLRVRDDGAGIDAAILENRGVSGHWGLRGMRERSELIGGTLEVRSRVGAGTEVELSLPASKAYAPLPGRRFFSSRQK